MKQGGTASAHHSVDAGWGDAYIRGLAAAGIGEGDRRAMSGTVTRSSDRKPLTVSAVS
ncbi:hypothetical protein SBD_0321 [Streptomyces bottropensis ATCC 25435]|uniref:Uncharacterized protein n=1 Tax=Streptomyces bottropensis ATCC 25435 TaxID=1054862 RepID=M3FZE7_9ACTN|nr:hypothetical protein SBD_0321 [Streptomyces bottropensis ATCC 25435]